MERNREARRASMVAASNGLSRRRHRPNSLRDSPDEDGQVEFSESVRLRERVKKDRDRERNRERDREREIERSSRSKRRRGDRLIHGGAGDRAGDDSSQESNDDEDYEDEDCNHQHQSNGGGGGGGGGGGAARSVPPNPSAAPASFPNHHHPSSSGNHHHHHQQNHLHHHKTFPPSSTNVLRTSPVWKSGDEVIGISVPRKARSAHTKRSHDWISCTGGAAAANGGGVGRDQNHRQTSTSPVRQSLVSTSLSPAPPLSPTSSNVSGRKKIKANGSKQRPPKTSSKSTSSNREELEIEIAEVLYGLMTQSQAPSKKENAPTTEVNNRSSGDAVSSAVSNSQSPPILPMNTNSCAAPFTAIAPKRKKPRQVSENQSSPSIRSSPSSASAKPQNDQIMTLKAEASSPNSEKMPFENGGSLYALTSPLNSQGKTMPVDQVPESVVDSETKPAGCEPSPREDHEAARQEDAQLLKKDSAAVALEVSNCEDSAAVTTATTYEPSAVSEVESHTEKIQIDLMAPPPPFRSSPEGEGKVDFCSTVEHNRNLSDSITEMRLDDGKVGKLDQPTLEAEEKKARDVVETEPKKRNDGKGQDSDLQLDLEKLERDNAFADNKPQQLAAKTSKEQQSMVMEKAGQSSSLALPMSIPSWSCGLPPLGYMSPLQGVLTMDGSTIPSTPLQPVFSQPRPKRCASHCYIARNIHLLQQFMKMNPFWPPAANPASLFGSTACNLNVVPATEFNGNIVGRGGSTGLDKGHGLAIFPGLGSKDKCSQASNIPDSVPRNQQILLQQPLPPPVAPNSLLPGHTYIIPLNQQQAAPLPGGATMSTAATARSHVSSSATNSAVGGNASATAAGGNHAAASFSYPNVPPNETPYLAILQNNAYFQIPAVGAPLNYRGAHPQPLPLFNGSFYSPQMIHPTQLQQQPTSSHQSKQMQQGQQNTSLSSGSSSSHKHLQNQQKRPQGHAAPINGNNGNGSPLPFPASKSHTAQPQHLQNQNIHPPPQSRHIENELCGEDSPSTAESRARPPMNVYNQNYLMQIHHSNFGAMASSAAMGVVPAPTSSSGNNSEKKQQRALKTGLESMLHQHFAMPFASISGGASAPGNDISSVAPNRAIFQTLPEATRQNFQMVPGAAAAQQKKSYGDDSRVGSGDPTAAAAAAAEERKVSSSGKAPPASVRQSMALSGSDLTDVSASKMTTTPNNVIDSSRSMSIGMPSFAGAPISKAKLNAQYQKQMLHQLQQQQLQHIQQLQQQKQLGATVAQSKPPPTSNGIVPSEFLTSSAAAPVGGSMFSTSISAFPQNLVQMNSNSSSPSRSPQWKSSAARASTSQMQSSLAAASSSVKNHTQQQQQQQQQQLRAQQNHNQISFGANHNSTSQGQHPPNSGQSQSSTVMAGSPTTSSISKGAAASGSPRTATSASMSNKTDQTPSQQGKPSIQMPNQKSSPASGRSAPSILGNQHAIPSTSGCGSNKNQMQPHLPKGAHQSQLFFSGSYVQAQSTNPSSASATSGYFVQRRHPEQQQAQHPLGSAMPSSSSSSMLTMCPVSLGSGGSTPNHSSKATAASAYMRNTSLPSQSIPQFSSQSSGNQHHILPAGFSYVQQHPSSAAQVKPTEQKQPAGNDNLNACWQPEKR